MRLASAFSAAQNGASDSQAVFHTPWKRKAVRAAQGDEVVAGFVDRLQMGKERVVEGRHQISLCRCRHGKAEKWEWRSTHGGPPSLALGHSRLPHCDHHPLHEQLRFSEA